MRGSMKLAILFIIAIMLTSTIGALIHPIAGMAALAAVAFVGYQLER